MIDHLLQIRVLQIRVLQIRVLQIRVLQIRVLQIRVLQIQSVFYKSNPVRVLQYAEISRFLVSQFDLTSYISYLKGKSLCMRLIFYDRRLCLESQRVSFRRKSYTSGTISGQVLSVRAISWIRQIIIITFVSLNY